MQRPRGRIFHEPGTMRCSSLSLGLDRQAQTRIGDVRRNAMLQMAGLSVQPY